MERVILCPTASDRDNRSKTMQELREKLPPCPICGRKPYLLHNVFDGADYGYSVGCPAFRLNDGIHGFVRTEILNNFDDTAKSKMPAIYGCDTKEEAFEKWVKYCEKYKGKTNE